ncbi:alpha/beta fold hydrolase [Paenibacillus qinlingensis]|uniref:alpha/beta fold hydrolase n=1 Tax=Paenibacillus qinlingensis TaxID=1837343 RepID=UPI001566E969|nr:alpha/beta fold hydrolase [Paenibacillus qinlingensis]NQX60738.1 alpha/beta fold hydrolase [Paenibacillus qinlingensis]
MPTVNREGCSIYYTERGKGAPLVLLMGLGADSTVWEQHVQAYEAHFRCILVDNRGAGRTGKPNGPYTTRGMAKDTLAVLDDLGIKRAHVSGISMGSGIAQHVALLSPERVLSLTLNCPWHKVDVYTRRIFETLRNAYEVMTISDFQKLLQLFIFTPAYHEAHLDDLLAKQQGASEYEYSMPTHAFQAQCDACNTHNTKGLLGSIVAPTLITVGERDVFTPPHLSRSIAKEIPHAEVVVFKDSGHTHHWDQLERFNELTLSFMLRQESVTK